jgi:hypothetical protein
MAIGRTMFTLSIIDGLWPVAIALGSFFIIMIPYLAFIDFLGGRYYCKDRYYRIWVQTLQEDGDFRRPGPEEAAWWLRASMREFWFALNPPQDPERARWGVSKWMMAKWAVVFSRPTRPTEDVELRGQRDRAGAERRE